VSSVTELDVGSEMRYWAVLIIFMVVLAGVGTFVASLVGLPVLLVVAVAIVGYWLAVSADLLPPGQRETDSDSAPVRYARAEEEVWGPGADDELEPRLAVPIILAAIGLIGIAGVVLVWQMGSGSSGEGPAQHAAIQSRPSGLPTKAPPTPRPLNTPAPLVPFPAVSAGVDETTATPVPAAAPRPSGAGAAVAARPQPTATPVPRLAAAATPTAVPARQAPPPATAPPSTPIPAAAPEPTAPADPPATPEPTVPPDPTATPPPVTVQEPERPGNRFGQIRREERVESQSTDD
jgi:hypothetical protein